MKRPPRETRPPSTAPSPAAVLQSAQALHQAGRVAEAMAQYRQALALEPRFTVARHNLGILLLDAGHLAEACELLELAFVEGGDAPHWPHTSAHLGLRLYHENAWEDALRWLEHAAAFLPADAPRRPEVLAALERCRPRPYLAPEVWDPVQRRSLLRTAPRESDTYVYAIDVVGTCNLRCPTCPVGNFKAADRPKGFMEPALFERILDKIVAERVAERPDIWLYNWGEPLLHPELPAMIGAVKQRGLRCLLSSNLNIEQGLREVVRAAPDDLKVSLSGFDAASYARTHARGHLALVKSNLYRLRHYLDRYRVGTRVWVGHHLYRDTVGQVESVAALCRELGFEHHPMAAFYMPLERLVEALDGRAPPDPTLDLLIEHPTRYVDRIRQRRSERHDCELRANQTVINHDGTVALCCTVYDKPNMLGLSFVDTPHAELERAKYAHPYCSTCMSRGVSYSVVDAHRVQGPIQVTPNA